MIETRFPRWADNPLQFLIWEVDEIIPVALFWIMFLPTRNLLAGLIIGIFFMRIYKYNKERKPAFFYLHYLWNSGIWAPKFKNLDMLRGYVSYYRE